MPQIEFFAVREDLASIFDHLFSNTDIEVFEMYSEFDQELRRFRSTGKILAALPLGYDRWGSGKHHLFQLWSPSVTPLPEIKRINFNGRVEGHTHRFTVEGWGLMQLYTGGIYERTITRSYFGHNSERRAINWGYSEGVDWKAFGRLSNKIQYLLRKKLAVGRACAMPVLKGSLEMHKHGFKFVCGRQECKFSQELSPSVQRTSLVRYNQSCS